MEFSLFKIPREWLEHFQLISRVKALNNPPDMRWGTEVSLTGFRPVGGDVFIQFHDFKFLKILQFIWKM